MGDIGICSVVAAELTYGVAKSGSERNRQALDLFLAPLAICALIWSAGVHRSAPWTH
jgi:tRNA(fMet)-specific endonuclease VapC